MPFTIPGKWKWTVIGSVVTLISGRDLEKNQILENDLGVPYITGASQIQDQVIIVNRWTNSPSVFSELGDVLLTCKGTVGKITINNIGKVHIARQIMSLRPCKEIDKKYLAYYLMSIVKFLINHAKSMIPGIDRKTVLGMSIPVPPFAEQHRIVSKLNQVFDQIDHAEKAYNELSGPLSESFRQLCLEKAIQGKIVPQLESEPGVEQIGEAPENVPFAIPEKWKWCQIKNLTTICSARRVHKSDWQMEGVPFFRAREIAKLAEQGFVNNELFISEELYAQLTKGGLVEEGDLMITAVGTLGKVYIVKRGDRFYYKDASVICMKRCQHIDPHFAKIIFTSPFMKNQIIDASSGTTVGTITIKGAMDYWVPIPPIEEQHRIVAKLNELLGIVVQLENTISAP